MSARVYAPRDGSQAALFPRQRYVGGNKSTPARDRRPTVTRGRSELLLKMIEERRSVFTAQESGWAAELEALLEANDIDLRVKGDGTPMPYERWARAFEWLKTVNVRMRQAAAQAPVDRNPVPLIVRELGPQEAMGVYETPDGVFYVVSQSRRNGDHTVARRLEEFSGDRLMLNGVHRDIRSVVERGAVYRLKAEWKISPERALEFIAVVGRCPRCVGMGFSGRLRDGTSVEMGAGKVCAHQMGFGAAYDLAARANYRAKRIAAGKPVRGGA